MIILLLWLEWNALLPAGTTVFRCKFACLHEHRLEGDEYDA